MKKLLFGLVTAIAISFPVAAQAQSFESFPNDDPNCTIVNSLCYLQMEGTQYVMSIPTGYSGRYMLGVALIDGIYLVFMYDQYDQHTVAAMTLTTRYEVLGLQGDSDYFLETDAEIVHILNNFRLN